MDFDRALEEMWPLVDYCDYVFFSKQLADQHGWLTPKDACAIMDEKMRMRWGLNLKRPYIIFMWRKEGVACVDPHGNYTLVPAYTIKPSKMVDPLGAGDTLTASFIYARYIRERDVSISLDFGNRMASHKCTKYGYDHIADILVSPVS
ncbi:ketohexokinase [Drosophila willistoni]|nr:ketohexokinase [Drosophila willistoni]